MKMQLLRQTLASILLIALISACDNSEATADPIEPKIPGKSVGILPVNAEACSDFKEVAGASDKATIYFSWSTAENATNYLVQIFEAETEVISTTVTTTNVELILEKGKSYSWAITSKNSTGEATSNTLSFTTPGEPLGNFAPYAAEISTEYNSSAAEISISWIGNDEDGDILTYDISLKDEGGNDIFNQSDLSETTLNPILVTLGETYTIRITSRDSSGNFSISTSTIKAGD